VRRANLFDVELSYDEEPEGYGSGYRRIRSLVGARDVNLTRCASPWAPRAPTR
jgi:hypothetical protein